MPSPPPYVSNLNNASIVSASSVQKCQVKWGWGDDFSVPLEGFFKVRVVQLPWVFLSSSHVTMHMLRPAPEILRDDLSWLMPTAPMLVFMERPGL